MSLCQVCLERMIGTLNGVFGATPGGRRAMFVEPSYAKYMDGSKIAAAFGKPTAKILDTDENIKSEKH